MRALLLAALTVLVAGCAEPSNYRVAGTFMESATAEDVASMRAAAEARGGQFVTLESYPLQFVASGLQKEPCEEVRAFASQQASVARVGRCTN